MPRTMRAAIYCRISSDPEGTALGVERQEHDCRKLCADRGWEVVQVYTDNDISASGKRVRPEWERLLQDTGMERFDALVAYSSSRMYRRPADLQRLIELARGLEIATVASGTIDLSTADGRMVAGLLAQIDQGELERTSERIIRKRKELVAKGYWAGGNRPFGYRVTRMPDGWKLEVNPEEAVLIQSAAAQVLNGVSASSIAREWKARGVPVGRTPSSVVLLLSRDRPGILTPQDTARLRALFDTRKTGKRRSYLLTGLLVCGICGNGMSGKPRGNEPRYVCLNGTHLTIDTPLLDLFVCAEAARRKVEAPHGVTDVHSPLLAERESLEEQLRELGAAWANGDPFAEGAALAIRERIANLDTQLNLDPADAERKWRYEWQWIDSWVEEAEPYPWDTGPEAWAELTQDPAMRSWLETLVESVTITKGRPGHFDRSRVQIKWRTGVVPVRSTIKEAS